MAEIMDTLPRFLDRISGRTRDDIDDLRLDLLKRQPSVEPASSPDQGPTRRELSIMDCFACGRSFCDGDGGFCSPRGREAFDAGWPVYQPPVIRYGLPKGRHGFLIKCAGCQEPFDSKGLRCCSQDCERAYQRKQKIETELAGANPRVAKRGCGRAGCRVELPNWRNGRRVRAKFCSPRCQKSAARSAVREPDSPQAHLSAKQAKKCPEIGPSRRAVEASSVSPKPATAPAPGQAGTDKPRAVAPGLGQANLRRAA